MATEKIQIDINVTGGDKAAGDVKKVGDSLDKAATSGTSFRAQISGTNTAVGALVSALSAADPRIAQFTFAMSGARSALSGFMAILGGPAGLAAGVVAGGAIAAIAMWARGNREAAEAVEEHRKALDGLRESSKRLALATGQGPTSSEEMLAGLQRTGQAKWMDPNQMAILRAKAAAERRAAPTVSVGPNGELITEEAPTETPLFGRMTPGKRQEFLTGKKPTAGKRGSGPTEFDRAQEVDAQIARLKALEAAPGQDRAAAQFADEQARSNARVEAFREGLEQEFEIETEMRSEQRAREEAAYEEHMERVKQTRMETTQSILNIGEFASQSFAKGLTQLVKGQKVAVKAILEGIGDQMVAEGTHMVFKGTAAAFIPGMQGSTALVGIGLAEIAAGLALGAATAGGAPSGGGGSLGTARPVMSVDGSRDDRPIIINLTNSIGPSAELGLVTAESNVRAKTKYGSYVGWSG